MFSEFVSNQQILNHFLIALFIFYDNESMKGQSDNNAKLVSRRVITRVEPSRLSPEPLSQDWLTFRAAKLADSAGEDFITVWAIGVEKMLISR